MSVVNTIYCFHILDDNDNQTPVAYFMQRFIVTVSLGYMTFQTVLNCENCTFQDF